MSDTDESNSTGPGGSDLIREMGLRAVVAEDFRAHQRDFTLPGFQTLLVYRIGTWAWTLPKVFRWPVTAIYLVMFLFCRNVYGIELRRTVTVGRRFVIGHQHGIVIHRFATFGNDCVVRQGVTLGIASEARWEYGVGPVIGNGVSFSPGAIVIGNVSIGDNSQIGPNCVVTADVPADRILFLSAPRVLPRDRPEPA